MAEQMASLNETLTRILDGASLETVSLDPVEAAKRIADIHNRSRGDLIGYDCPECLNRGHFMEVDEHGNRHFRDCKCMVIRRNKERIARSGLADLMEQYTFDAWQTPEPWQKQILSAAKGFAENPDGWFVVTGKVGCGKTHICTAICGELLNKGLNVQYMLWRESIGRLKAVVNDPKEYDRQITPLMNVKVLYIDDLFKTGKGMAPTSADFNVAFELINHRYIKRDLVTLISSELTIGEILEYDEAVGSRIYECAKRSSCYFALGDKKNWRLRV